MIVIALDECDALSVTELLVQFLHLSEGFSCSLDRKEIQHRGCYQYRSRVHQQDRKSTRLNSSHVAISYAVFCSPDHVCLPSFPTRRSSDLERCLLILD